MRRKHEPSGRRTLDARVGQGRIRAATCCTAVGIAGSVACSASMTAAAVGVFAAGGTAAARGTSSAMAGMGSSGQPGGVSHMPAWLDALIRFGPAITIVSVLLVIVAVTVRRRIAALPTVIGGVILYAGMYLQPSVPWMYVAIVVGTALLVVAYLTTVSRPPLMRARTVAGRAP